MGFQEGGLKERKGKQSVSDRGEMQCCSTRQCDKTGVFLCEIMNLKISIICLLESNPSKTRDKIKTPNYNYIPSLHMWVRVNTMTKTIGRNACIKY